jgi:hypothetical protein
LQSAEEDYVMATRILGPTGSKKRRRFLLVPVLVAGLAAIFLVTGAQAVHDIGVFELDRNAVDQAAAGEDWDKVCPAPSVPPVASDISRPATDTPHCLGGTTAERSTFTKDGVDKGDDIFTGAQPGGNSKDPDLISGWRWKLGSVQDKDDLEHAGAAQYSVPTSTCPNIDQTLPSCVLLYLTADRFAVSGDSQLGFWLFRKKVSENAIPAGSSVGSFSGSHTARTGCPGVNCSRGDILILADFLKGGAAPTVRVFEWVGSGGSDGSLDLIAGTTAQPADCLGTTTTPPVGNNDNLCATVNTANTDSPWKYTPKAGTANVWPAGAFFEGGINMSALGLGNECFSTFEAETRASQSPTSTLSDFVIHTFARCGATLTTQSSQTGSTVAPGTKVTDTATITGTGTANPPFPTSDAAHGGTNVTFTICGPIGASDTCDSSDANHTPQTVGASKSLSPTATQGVSTATSDQFDTTGKVGRFCWQASWPGDENYSDGASSADYTNECFTVADTSSVTTLQNWRPNDSAEVTSANGTALAGNVTFTLYSDGTCGANSGSVLYGPKVIDVTTGTGTSSDRTVKTNNDGSHVGDYLASADATVSWKVEFSPTAGSGVTAPANPTCEKSVLDLTPDQ